MKLLMYLSDFILPLVIFYIVAYGLSKGRPVYDDFIRGAGDGLKTVASIAPTIIGLMTAVRVLRASGFLDLLAELLTPVAELFHFPVSLLPVALVRMVSSSAANGLVTDIFATYGPDSLEGLAASIMMGCTESVFYTMSVYFAVVKIQKTRFTLAGALTATFAGVVASVVLALAMAG